MDYYTNLPPEVHSLDTKTGCSLGSLLKFITCLSTDLLICGQIHLVLQHCEEGQEQDTLVVVAVDGAVVDVSVVADTAVQAVDAADVRVN